MEELPHKTTTVAFGESGACLEVERKVAEEDEASRKHFQDPQSSETDGADCEPE